MPRLYWDQAKKDAGEDGWQPVPPRLTPRHYIQPSDTLAEPLYSHADGRHYTSKSKMLREQRAMGFEEVGNERVPQARYEPSSREIRETIERAWSKYE